MDYNAIEKILIEQIQNDELAIFAGAGVSIGAGYVSWKDLLRDIAEEIGLEIDKEHDFITVAQYHYNRFSRNKLDQKILNEFSRVANDNSLINIICKLPIRTIWTTNYDKLIEETYKKFNKKIDVKINNNHLSLNLRNKECDLFKIHGDKDDPSSAIITRDDYEFFFREKSLFVNKLISDLLSKTFIFIGYSFGDPNFEHVLSSIRYDLMGKSRTHYCFQKVISKDDYENENDYRYDKIKQELKIEDLKKYNIHTVLIENFDDLTRIFNNVLFELTKRNIFISGAASCYNDFGSDDEAKEFIIDIAYELTKSGYNIISGYGLGVGGFVVDGIISSINDNKLNAYEKFIVKPFPQGISNKNSRKELWTNHRRNLISKASTSIFLFGNKVEDGELVLSNGMQEEFEISKEMGNIIIPIASTGYKARDIYNLMIEDNDLLSNHYLLNLKELAEEKKAKNVVDIILKIIEESKSTQL